jgi:hypothetical protein
MVEATNRQRFFAKALTRGRIAESAVRQDLDGNIALQFFVERAKDDAHAARANLLQQAIVPEQAANTGRWR